MPTRQAVGPIYDLENRSGHARQDSFWQSLADPHWVLCTSRMEKGEQSTSVYSQINVPFA